jgi:hypothetical protein
MPAGLHYQPALAWREACQGYQIFIIVAVPQELSHFLENTVVSCQ